MYPFQAPTLVREAAFVAWESCPVETLRFWWTPNLELLVLRASRLLQESSLWKAKWGVRRGEWRAVRREGAEVRVDRTTYPCNLSVCLGLTDNTRSRTSNAGVTQIEVF